MHDLVGLEGQGVVAAYVASDAFVDAGAAQARALGYAAVPAVHVPHPIQDRTDDEMRELAERALDAVLAAVTGSAVTGSAGAGPGG